MSDIRKYRAKSMQEALALVRSELGPHASVLRTREVRGGGILPWLTGTRIIEVLASAQIEVPSRLPHSHRDGQNTRPVTPWIKGFESACERDALDQSYRAKLDALQSRMHEMSRRATGAKQEMSPALYRLFTDLIEADVHEELARSWIDRLQREKLATEETDAAQLKQRLATWIEGDLAIAGPIRLKEQRRRLVALVGPTGVGKTTTIAKLAANFRLREKRKVGLITVDTYRIAAVEQLRTYADIIDLPMEIVATPREMRQAVARMAHLDLILMDTAGRSPRDEIKIQELKSLLAEAAPDEVHLVLSSVAGATTLAKTAQQFASVGTTALVLTKLDEAMSLGNLLPLLRGCQLPLSYLTYGQNVPDDIGAADAARLARAVLGLEPITVN